MWDGAFFLGSLVPALLVGVALGNVIRGVPMDAQGNYIGTFWELLNPYSLLVGVTGLFLLVQHGAAWLSVKSEGELHDRVWRYRKVTFWICAVLAVATSLATILTVSRASDNVFGRPAGWLFLVVFLVGRALHDLADDEGGRRAQVVHRLGHHHHRAGRHRRRGQLPRHGAGTRHAGGDQPHGGSAPRRAT